MKMKSLVIALTLGVSLLSTSVNAQTFINGKAGPEEIGDLVHRKMVTGPDWFKKFGHVALYEQQDSVLEVMPSETGAVQLNSLISFVYAGDYIGSKYGQLTANEANIAIEEGLDQIPLGSKYVYSFKYKTGKKETYWENVGGQWKLVTKITPGGFRCDTFMNYVHADAFTSNGSYLTPSKMYSMIPNVR